MVEEPYAVVRKTVWFKKLWQRGAKEDYYEGCATVVLGHPIIDLMLCCDVICYTEVMQTPRISIKLN